MSYGVKVARRNSCMVDSSKLCMVHYITWSHHILQQIVQKPDRSQIYSKKKYKMCTFNKIVNGEQITVQFHVDNLKVSHKDQVVLDDFLKDLRDEFGQEDELTENK